MIGSGPLIAHCVRALARSGVTDLATVLDAGDAELCGADFVLHTFDCSGISGARDIAAACAERGVPLVQALTSRWCVLLGPRGGGGPCWPDWSSVWLRLSSGDRAAFRDEPRLPAHRVIAQLLAHQLVSELFRTQTDAEAERDPGTDPDADGGAGDPSAPDRVRALDTRNLELTHHRVLPHPHVRPATPQSLGEFVRAMLALRQGPRWTDERFAARMATAIDARFGPIRSLGESDLAQLPLRQARAVIADPASGRHTVVTGHGKDFGMAWRRTAMKAVAAYSTRVFDPRRLVTAATDAEGRTVGRLWGLRLHDGEPCLVDAAEVFTAPCPEPAEQGAFPPEPLLEAPESGSGTATGIGTGITTGIGIGAGRDWTEMVTAGVLAHCRQTAIGASVGEFLPLDGWDLRAPDPLSRRYRRLITACGRHVECFDLTSATDGVPTVGLTLDGTMTEVVSRLRLADAVRDGLEQLLARAQSGGPFPLLAAPPVTPHHGVHWRPPAPVTLADAVAALRRTVGVPALVPLDHDAAMARIMPYVGKVVLLKQ